MPRVIAIMNQKGGVGKTTTTLNLGAALAARGKRVLLVDLDPQANLTIGLGKRASDLSESVYELLTNPKVDLSKLIVQTNWERLNLVPSHIDLSGAEIEMVTMIGRETRLSKSLDQVRENFDYILIDCLPSLSLLTVNAMAAASEVFVPLQAHPFALEGLGKLFEVVGMIREAMNPTLRVSGVLVTMFDGRTNVSKVTLENLRRDDRLREHIFTTTIKQNIKVAESQKDGVPVIYFDSSCHASKAYLALCEEVLEMESGCIASKAADAITARQKNSGEKLTFTSDLLAPRPQNSEPQNAPQTPAEPAVHATPVTALVNSTPAPAQPAEAAADDQKKIEHVSAPEKTPASKAEPAAEIRTPPPETRIIIEAPPAPPVIAEPPRAEPAASAEFLATAQLRNSPDVETLHPSVAVMIPPELANADRVEAAQILQSLPVSRASTEVVDISDETYRPRLSLKPGSCKIPLPPMTNE